MTKKNHPTVSIPKKIFRLKTSISQRCNNPKCKGYKYYGGKGVKDLLSLEDLIFLWKRDEAEDLEKPSIDRIDSSGNYEIKNCRFIERGKNSSIAHTKFSTWPKLKTQYISVRIKESEKKYLEQKARLHDLSISDLVRTYMISNTSTTTTQLYGGNNAFGLNRKQEENESFGTLDQGKSKKKNESD